LLTRFWVERIISPTPQLMEGIVLSKEIKIMRKALRKAVKEGNVDLIQSLSQAIQRLNY
jgi:hypothetical protein